MPRETGDLEGEERTYGNGVVRSLDGARVSTIHSFCTEILRAHAIELGINPEFQVLDPGAAEVALRESVEEAINSALDESLKQEPASLIRVAADYDLPKFKQIVASLCQAARTASGFEDWSNRDQAARVDGLQRVLRPADRPVLDPSDSEQQ